MGVAGRVKTGYDARRKPQASGGRATRGHGDSMDELANIGNFSAIFFVGELVRYVLIAGLIIGLIWLGSGWTRARKIQRRIAGWREIAFELRHSLASIVVYTLIAAFVLVLVIHGHAWLIPDPPLGEFLLAQVGLMVFHDTWFYWTHRALHSRALFRSLHLVHHRSKTPTVWTAYSFSLGEAFIQGAFLPIWVVLVPTSPMGYVVFFTHQLIRNCAQHSGYELAWPGFTRSRWTGWLATATHHDLNHSEGAHNFGLWFTWWDRLMGTLHPHYHERFEAVARPWFGSRADPEAVAAE